MSNLRHAARVMWVYARKLCTCNPNVMALLRVTRDINNLITIPIAIELSVLLRTRVINVE